MSEEDDEQDKDLLGKQVNRKYSQLGGEPEPTQLKLN